MKGATLIVARLKHGWQLEGVKASKRRPPADDSQKTHVTFKIQITQVTSRDKTSFKAMLWSTKKQASPHAFYALCTDQTGKPVTLPANDVIVLRGFSASQKIKALHVTHYYDPKGLIHTHIWSHLLMQIKAGKTAASGNKNASQLQLAAQLTSIKTPGGMFSLTEPQGILAAQFKVYQRDLTHITVL